MLHHLKKKLYSDNGDMAKVDDFGLSVTCFAGSGIVIYDISTQKAVALLFQKSAKQKRTVYHVFCFNRLFFPEQSSSLQDAGDVARS